MAYKLQLYYIVYIGKKQFKILGLLQKMILWNLQFQNYYLNLWTKNKFIRFLYVFHYWTNWEHV